MNVQHQAHHILWCSGDISDVKAGVITAVNRLFVTQPQYFSLEAGGNVSKAELDNESLSDKWA